MDRDNPIAGQAVSHAEMTRAVLTDQEQSLSFGRHPHLPGTVFINDMHYDRLGQMQQGLHRGDLASFDDVETLVGTDPNPAVPALDKCPHGVAGEAVAAIEHGHAVLVQPVDAGALGSNPQVVLPVFEHRADRVVFMPARPGKVLKLTVDVAAKSTIRAHPQAPALPRCQGPRQVALQTLGLACRCEFSVAQPQ